uniref:Uncharacterized protein n=1 Tax=Knipowitschia caucasica TaxID=637954 RepID=A0AAV2J227_KNICA
MEAKPPQIRPCPWSLVLRAFEESYVQLQLWRFVSERRGAPGKPHNRETRRQRPAPSTVNHNSETPPSRCNHNLRAPPIYLCFQLGLWDRQSRDSSPQRRTAQLRYRGSAQGGVELSIASYQSVQNSPSQPTPASQDLLPEPERRANRPGAPSRRTQMKPAEPVCLGPAYFPVLSSPRGQFTEIVMSPAKNCSGQQQRQRTLVPDQLPQICRHGPRHIHSPEQFLRVCREHGTQTSPSLKLDLEDNRTPDKIAAHQSHGLRGHDLASSFDRNRSQNVVVCPRGSNFAASLKDRTPASILDNAK